MSHSLPRDIDLRSLPGLTKNTRKYVYTRLFIFYTIVYVFTFSPAKLGMNVIIVGIRIVHDWRPAWTSIVAYN